MEEATAEHVRSDVARASRRRSTESTELPEFAPPVALSDGPLGAVQAADREIARQTAIRARAVADFATSRPATADRGQGEPGAMSANRWAARPELLRSVSEWAAQELVVSLSITTEAAEKLLETSLTLVHRLPGTLAALEAGALHPGHLWPMLEKVAPIEKPAIRAEVEAKLLRWAAGRVTTPAQLGAKARREVLRRDAGAAARRLEKAIRERGVHVRPDVTDGMAVVTALLTLPEARLLVQALEAYADALPDDPENPRTRQQKMADCLLDLVLRPGETDAPTVQLMLTVVASIGTMAGGDEPGEVDGHVVPAEMIRELLRRFAGRPADPTDSAAHPETAPDAMGAPAEGALTDRSRPADTVRRWRKVSVDDLRRWSAESDRQVILAQLGLGPEPEPPVEAVAGPGREAPPPGEEQQWWRAAEAAVGMAGRSLRRADEAMRRARRLVRAASRADAADEAEWEAGPGRRVTDAEDALAALAACTEEQRNWLADLLLTTAGGGLVERPRIALTDALSGTLLALTDLPGLRRSGTCGARACTRVPGSCTHDLAGRPGCGPPGATDGYRPSAPLDRWIRARDRRCRFPGCRRRVPRGGELDHSQPYPLGQTSARNLVGYCTGHHRGKHQAPGWHHDLASDGTLTVTTPTGLTAVTTPPPY